MSDGATTEGQAVVAPPSDIKARATALIEKRSRLKVAERKPAPAPAPAKPAPAPVRRTAPSKSAGADTLAELQAELASLRGLRETIETERSQAALAGRVDYARRSGLRPGVSDDVARSLMAAFNVDDSTGKKAFEDFRRANPAMFEEAYSAEAAQARAAKKLEPEKAKNKLFGDKFISANLKRNLR